MAKTEWLKSKIRKKQLKKADLEKCKEYLTNIADRPKIEPPKDEEKEVERRKLIYRCVERNTSKVMVPSLEEVRPAFHGLMKEVEFCSRSVVFGTLEFLFKEEEYASVAALSVREKNKLVFFPMHMGNRMVSELD